MTIYNVFTLLGGIALFLFGMNMMSDGLEKVAGSRMRSILEKLTKNRLIGTLVGIFITAIIQSSSAVTAMVVSFVNAGLMDLSQSVGVIFGANIGTSITGQLMAFNFDDYAPLIVALSVVFYLFIKKDIVKKVAYVFLGFGVLFMGMGIMKEAMGVMAESDAVTGAIQSTTNPFILLILGLVITAVIQSNSAMTGILIGLAASGLITVEMSFYVILGSNIGATVTALIASVNGNRNSKRAALIHFFFNVIGSAIIFIILMFAEEPITNFILYLSPGADALDVTTRAVAMANTVFRVFNVLIMFPFAKGLVKLTQIVLPVKDHSKDVEDYTKLKYVGDKTIAVPSTVLVETSKEIKRVGDLTANNMDISLSMLTDSFSQHKYDEVMKIEEYVDLLTMQLQEFMAKISQTTVPLREEEKVGGYFHVIIDLERISDHAENLAEFAKVIKEERIEFSEEALEELRTICPLVVENVRNSIDIFTSGDFTNIDKFTAVEIEIDKISKEYQANHIRRMTEGTCSPKSGIFSDIMINLERVGDHANNIAFALAPQGMEDEVENRVENILSTSV